MKRIWVLTILMFLLSGQGVSLAQAEAITIFEIQYTTDPDGDSPKDGEVLDCVGGVVTHKLMKYTPRLVLQDPIIRDPNAQGEDGCWGAIQVKDRTGESFGEVAVGDWVEFYNVTVEESVGTTFLQYYGAPASFTIVSSNNPVPEPVVVNLNEIPSPVEEVTSPGGWYVSDHLAEKYESMRLEIRDVVVMEKGLGKKSDNYILQSAVELSDPNISCWATDYMNVDKDPSEDFHPYVEVGRHFCKVWGVLEQYTEIGEGWDYYQLLTTETEDFDQPADLDGDCDVDLLDYGHFAGYWLVECVSDPNLCGGADIAVDDVVNTDDLGEFVYYWLDGIN